MNQRKPCKIINDIEFQKKKYHVYIIYIFVEQMTMAQYKTTIYVVIIHIHILWHVSDKKT